MSAELGRIKGCIPVAAWRTNLLLIVTEKVICHYVPKIKAKELLMPAGFSDLAISRRLVKLCDLDPEELLKSISDKDGKIKVSGCIKLDEIRKVEVKKGVLGLGGQAGNPHNQGQAQLQPDMREGLRSKVQRRCESSSKFVQKCWRQG